ncbi:MAG: SMC-Scp complex subunit ScpB [candidate division Zixibacteria bacterium]|nr:SMC-Scp complex subunit ScpB [candidate division Zixibacteria bacterium]
MDKGYQKSVVEALILASPEPLPARRIVGLIDEMTPKKVGQTVAELNNCYMETGSSYRIRELAGGYQFYILPEFTGFVEDLFARRRKMRLTRASLETLAIVAYRQPVTKSGIEHIRGVASDGVLHNLLEKKMITIKGRAETVGRPLQYGTTDEFLKFFGLARLEDLPKMSEIEELIKTVEPHNQGQLSLDPNALDAQMQQKLNVADGTFDPSSRHESEDEEGINKTQTKESNFFETTSAKDNSSDNNSQKSSDSLIIDEDVKANPTPQEES